MLTTRSQRWRDRRCRWVPGASEIDPSRLAVDVIDTVRQATPFVRQHHYAASMPVTRLSVGLFRNGGGGRSDLVGVCVFAHPVNNASVPKSAGLPDPRTACDLGRLVLLDDTGGNAETWMLSRAFKLLRQEKPEIVSVISYADPIRRTDESGQVFMPGHVGTLYSVIHAKLLIPLDGMEELRQHRRAAIFATSDVHAMRDRIAAVAPVVREGDIAPEYQGYSTTAIELTNGVYGKTDLILDILSGKIPSVRTSDEARLCSLFLHLKAATGVSLAARAKHLIDTNTYWSMFKCANYLDLLWPDRKGHPTVRRLHEICDQGFLRHHILSTRPTRHAATEYRYLFADVLERQYLLSGPSAYHQVDKIVVTNRNSRPPKKRVRLDPIDAQEASCKSSSSAAVQ